MKTIKILLTSFCTVLFVSSCSMNPTLKCECNNQDGTALCQSPPPSIGITLDNITFDQAKERAASYGDFISKNLPKKVCKAPRFWDVQVAEIQDLLKNSPADTVRVYLGRDMKSKNQDIRLMLVPIVSGNEVTNQFRDLITPCPSTCQSLAHSTLKPWYCLGARGNYKCCP